MEEEKAAYAEKLRRLFEAYGGDEDEALTPGASGKKASGEAAYVSTADKNDWDSLKTEASKWGMADAFGLPTGKYWEKVGGKPWWMEGIDAKFQDAGLPLMDVFQNHTQAKATTSGGAGGRKTGMGDQSSLGEANFGVSGTAAVQKPWSGDMSGWNISAAGGGSAPEFLAGTAEKRNALNKTQGYDLKDFITLLPYTHPGEAVIENLPYDGTEPPKMILLSNSAAAPQTNQEVSQSLGNNSPMQERDETLRALGIDPDTLSAEELDEYEPEAVEVMKRIIQDLGTATTEEELFDIRQRVSRLPQVVRDTLMDGVVQKEQSVKDTVPQLVETYRGYDAEGAQQAYQQARTEVAGAYGLDAKLAGAEKTYSEKMQALQEEKDALEGNLGMPGGTEAWYQSIGVRLVLLNDAMKWQEDSYYRAVDAIRNGFEQYLASQDIKEYDTSEGAMLSQLTTVYAPQAGETFEAWAERIRGVFGPMLDAAIIDKAQLLALNETQATNGAENRIMQLKTVLDEIIYQSLFRSVGYGDALSGMAEDENLLEHGYNSLSGLMDDLQSARGEDAQANLDLICDPANAKHLSMYLYIFEAYGSDAAGDYILHALPGMQAEAKGEAAYDPWELGTLFAKDSAQIPEEDGDGETSQEASLAFGEQRRIIEGPSPTDLLYAVMMPEQREKWASFPRTVAGLLTPEQMQRINSGESIEAVIAELDGLAPEQKALLVENAPPVLSNGQKADLMFLASALWVGYGLDSRQAALARIKANGGKITYEDLVDIGVYAPGELAESGTKERRKQERDKYGGPANFPGLLEWNYGLNQQGTSVDLLDQQFREQQMSEAYSVTMLMIGIAAGALVDKWLTGPASEPLGGGEGPLNLGEAPGAGSGGAQTGGAGENGQAEKIGGIGEYIDTTTDSLSKSEKLVVDDLVGQGKTVERIPANPKVEGGTPDFKVNGVLTELKTLENANTNTGMKRIQNGFSQGAESVIIDARASGLTEAQADEIIARVRGKYPNGILPGTVEIWIAGQVRTYP